jgi:hypothetical protein
MGSAEADLADAILKVFGALEDFYFDAHEIDRQIAAIDFGEAHGVLLRGNDGDGLAFFAAVDRIQDFLLRKTVMIGEAF